MLLLFYLKTVCMICVELLWEVKKNLCNFKAYLLQRKGCDKFVSHCQPNLYLAEQHIGGFHKASVNKW